jgi:hypothetical protein
MAQQRRPGEVYEWKRKDVRTLRGRRAFASCEEVRTFNVTTYQGADLGGQPVYSLAVEVAEVPTFRYATGKTYPTSNEAEAALGQMVREAAERVGVDFETVDLAAAVRIPEGAAVAVRRRR